MLIIIFLLFFASTTIAMNDDGDPFTPGKFDAWLQQVEREKELDALALTNPDSVPTPGTTSPQQQSSPSKPHTPPDVIITRIGQQLAPNATSTASTVSQRKRKADDSNDASNNPEKTTPQEPASSQNPPIERPITVMPCLLTHCNWCLRYYPELEGSQAANQRIWLIDQMFYHCHRTHWDLDVVREHIDYELRYHTQPEESE